MRLVFTYLDNSSRPQSTYHRLPLDVGNTLRTLVIPDRDIRTYDCPRILTANSNLHVQRPTASIQRQPQCFSTTSTIFEDERERKRHRYRPSRTIQAQTPRRGRASEAGPHRGSGPSSCSTTPAAAARADPPVPAEMGAHQDRPPAAALSEAQYEIIFCS